MPYNNFILIQDIIHLSGKNISSETEGLWKLPQNYFNQIKMKLKISRQVMT